MRSSSHNSPHIASRDGEDNDVKAMLLDDYSQMESGEHGDKASSVAGTEQDANAAKTRALLISFVAMLFFGMGNKIFQVLQFLPMRNYPLLVNLLSTFVYIPMSFAYIIPMQKYGTLITEEAMAVPKYKFAVMGALDSLAGIMQSLAVNYIANGSLVQLLAQAAIPSSLIISKFALGTKYSISQYVGAIVVVIGIAIVLVPSFEHPDSNAHAKNPAVWSFVMILSCVPMCLSSVYKEKALGDADIDAVYMNGWIALFQFFFAIVLLPPSAIASSVHLKDLPSNLMNGLKCLARTDSITLENHPGTKYPDDCHYSPVYVSIYLMFNLGYNVLILLILKYGSSNILWLALTIMVPAVNLCFAFKFMPEHQAITWEDLVGLILILGGLVAYRFWGKASKYFKQKFGGSKNVGVDKTPLIGAESPSMNTPMRGAGVHTIKKKRTRTRST